jgi:hypothetical protein
MSSCKKLQPRNGVATASPLTWRKPPASLPSPKITGHGNTQPAQRCPHPGTAVGMHGQPAPLSPCVPAMLNARQPARLQPGPQIVHQTPQTTALPNLYILPPSLLTPSAHQAYMNTIPYSISHPPPNSASRFAHLCGLAPQPRTPHPACWPLMCPSWACTSRCGQGRRPPSLRAPASRAIYSARATPPSTKMMGAPPTASIK